MELYINDVQYRFLDDYDIVEQAGSTAVMSLNIKIDDNEIPKPFDMLRIEQDGVILFNGVVGIPASPTYSTGFETDIYSLQVQSINALLRRRLISEAWQSKTTVEIVQDIFDDYISAEGITLGGISVIDFDYTYFVAQRKYVADVLDELVAPVGATWHISPDKKFYFLTKEDFVTYPAPTHLNSVQKTVSGLDTRTVQVIAGATAKTGTQIETFTWVADQNQITVGFEVDEEPTITINGTGVGVGVKGIESDNVNKTFLWSNASAIITVNSNALIKPVSGDTVVVSYIGTFDIEIENQNATKIAELAARTSTSGRIEKVETDTTIKSYNDGNVLANGLLNKYGESEETITCITDDTNLTDMLTIWTFNLPLLNIVGDYIISQRTLMKNKVIITLKNKSYYLKYGSIYNKYDKNIRRLSVNASTVILKTESSYNETLKASESWEQAGLVFYPTNGEWSDPTSLLPTMEMQA